MSQLQKKICLLGLFGVGKTSLLRRFVENAFDEKYQSTIGVKVDRKRVQLAKPADPLDLLIWDIAGLQEITVLVRNYFRGAHGALVVHDVTRPESLDALTEYCEQFLAVAPQAKLVAVGNKCDLVLAQDLTAPGPKKLGGQKSMPHFFTSAKSGENVEAAFLALAKLMIV